MSAVSTTESESGNDEDEGEGNEQDDTVTSGYLNMADPRRGLFVSGCGLI